MPSGGDRASGSRGDRRCRTTPATTPTRASTDWTATRPRTSRPGAVGSPAPGRSPRPPPRRGPGREARSGEPPRLRVVLVKPIAEHARHNGHADLPRERPDGATGHRHRGRKGPRPSRHGVRAVSAAAAGSPRARRTQPRAAPPPDAAGRRGGAHVPPARGGAQSSSSSVRASTATATPITSAGSPPMSWRWVLTSTA
ncbi:DUF664 domain-containing protein [Nocardiopsis sp. NPDC060348]|uniref:mycothiol transferase n=1 Tax=unclassified Nocardiopsis TaxID=2649073 RepID=UPI00093B08EB